MKACDTPHCNFYRNNGCCTEICKRNGVKRNPNYGDVIRNMSNEKLASLVINLFGENDICYKDLLEKLDGEVKRKVKVKIKYADPEMEKLRYIDGKSDWIDLRADENVFIEEGTYKRVSLGVAMQLPAGYEAHIVPRSSSFETFGIISTNHTGIVDESYCGDTDYWNFPAYCLHGKDIVNGKRGTQIHKGDRICQFRIMEHQPIIEFEECDSLGNKSRGGFGSTGKN